MAIDQGGAALEPGRESAPLAMSLVQIDRHKPYSVASPRDGVVDLVERDDRKQRAELLLRDHFSCRRSRW